MRITWTVNTIALLDGAPTTGPKRQLLFPLTALTALRDAMKQRIRLMLFLYSEQCKRGGTGDHPLSGLLLTITKEMSRRQSRRVLSINSTNRKCNAVIARTLGERKPPPRPSISQNSYYWHYYYLKPQNCVKISGSRSWSESAPKSNVLLLVRHLTHQENKFVDNFTRYQLHVLNFPILR